MPSLLYRFGLLLLLVCCSGQVLSPRQLQSRAVTPNLANVRVAHWEELFRNLRRIKKLVVLKLSGGPALDELKAMLRRRIEEDGVDHFALSVALNEIKPCSATATEAGILLWECSLSAYSALQPFSPTVAFAILVDNPLENAVKRFYSAHETDHMKRHVPISKYFRAQTKGTFSEEHLQHIRAFVVGGKDFLKGNKKYEQYHDLGNPQFRRMAADPQKALDVVRAMKMVVTSSDDFDAFVLMLRRRMGWPLRQVLYQPLLAPSHPTAADWPSVYIKALNNTPKVRSDWVFYAGAMEIAADQRRAFGSGKFMSQLDEFGALRQELVRKCDRPDSGPLLTCMISTYDRCVIPEGRTNRNVRTCGNLLRAIGDGDTSFNSLN